MKLITKNTDYATRALRFMAIHKDGVCAVSTLAKALKIPRPFLRKILQILNKKGLVKSQKGKGGGFILNRPPEKIFLTDLIEIFQGPIELTRCILKKNICPNVKRCMLKKKVNDIERYIVSELKSITIVSLSDGDMPQKIRREKGGGVV